MSRILYYGIFFDEESNALISKLDTKKLDIVPDYFHVTFRYLPNNDERINDVVGKEFELKIIGIANNGKNSGVLIEIPNNIKKYYINRYEENGKEISVISHMTLSISSDSKNRYTRDLDFKPLKEPIKVRGRFGYCIENVLGDKTSRYVTYKKVLWYLFFI